MSTWATKGKLREKAYSRSLHFKGIPVLICSKFLRQRGCGQVDVCIFLKSRNGNILELHEIKSSRGPSNTQLLRLRNSQKLLSALFNCSARLIIHTQSLEI